MNHKDNIVQELSDLNSRLAGLERSNTYAVPEGYFDGLAAQVLVRIKALEAASVAEELSLLAPSLTTLPKVNPYNLQQGYFENLSADVLQKIKHTEQSPEEELASLSPLLGELKKEMPYRVPKGYFEELTKVVPVQEKAKKATVVSLVSRTWFRLAAAAVITGIIVLAGLQFFSTEKEPGGKALAKFTRDFKKMNDQQKDDMIDFFDAGMDGKETAQLDTDKKQTKQVQELLEGVSDEELKDFQEQTEDIQEVLMTN